MRVVKLELNTLVYNANLYIKVKCMQKSGTDANKFYDSLDKSAMDDG